MTIVNRSLIFTSFVFLLTGCSAAKDTGIINVQQETETSSPAGISEKQEETTLSGASAESVAEPESIAETEEILAVTHLEIEELYNYAPVYQLDVKKVEGGTGRLLDFETDANAGIEPNEKAGLIYQIIDAKKPDLYTLSFWNYEELDTVRINIDGLDYDFNIPDSAFQEISLDKQITYENFALTLQNMRVYPNAAELIISGVNHNDFYKNSIMIELADDDTLYPPYDYYETESGRVLVYVLEKGVEADGIQGLSIGVKDHYQKVDLKKEKDTSNP